MRHPALNAIAVSALALCGAQAQADTVQFLGYAHGSAPINYNLTGPSMTSGSTGAGGFITRVNDTDPNFTTYCVDLFQYIGFNQPAYGGYTNVSGASYTFRNPNANSDLAKLYSSDHAVNDALTEAAFQIAVWEIVYETTGKYALDGIDKGNAWFTSAGAGGQAALDLATMWLGNLGNGNGYEIRVLKSDTYQDEVYANRVPEPGTAGLALAALGMLGWAGRRRRG